MGEGMIARFRLGQNFFHLDPVRLLLRIDGGIFPRKFNSTLFSYVAVKNLF
jgi:hypothetical protein